MGNLRFPGHIRAPDFAEAQRRSHVLERKQCDEWAWLLYRQRGGEYVLFNGGLWYLSWCNRISAPSTLERRGQPLLHCRRKAVGAADPGWARLVGVMSSEPYTRDKCKGHFSCHSQRSLGKKNKAYKRQGEEQGVKVYKTEFTIKFLTFMSSLSNALCKGICDTFQINMSTSTPQLLLKHLESNLSAVFWF